MLGLLWIAAAGATSEPLPLEASSYTVDVTGPLAELVIRQTFRNRSAAFIDATYLFPLDNDAVVDGMVMRIGDRTLRSHILPRSEARDAWQEAADNGQIAALTEQQRPNVFTQDVSNLPPGQRIEVELRVVQPVNRVDGAWELVVPLVVAPRFVRPGDTEGEAVLAPYRPDDAAPPADLEPVRSVLADIDVVVHATAPIHSVGSPSHQPEIAVDDADASATVDEVALDRDFVLRWRTDGDAPQLGVLVAGDHALLMMEAPAGVPRGQGAPRELIWVLDTSCSMSGDKIELAKAAMLGALDTMDERDSFVVLGFGSLVQAASAAPVPATAENLKRGRHFVRGLRAEGGTWMEEALRVALQFPDDPLRRRMVVFVTDGQIGHDTELLAEIAATAGETTFVALGIGASPNRYLLDEMARLGGGVAAYAIVPDDLQSLIETMDRPVLTDFRIDWGNCEPSVVAPAAVPVLRPGHPVHLLARIDGACTDKVRVEALGDCQATFQLQPRQVPQERAIASTWAQARVMDLERRAMRGVLEDPGPEIEALGLTYGIVTSRTSRLAIDERIVNPGGEAGSVLVPLEVPHGEQHGVVRMDTESTSVGRVLTKEFLNVVPPGRAYQSAELSETAATVRNPNLAGGASNENTYLLDGANITDPVSGTLSVNYDRVRVGEHDPRSMARLPEVAGGPAAARIRTELPNSLTLAADARGAGFTGDPTAAGEGAVSLGGPVVRDRLWANLEGGARQVSLGSASSLAARAAGRVAFAPSQGHRLSAGGVVAPGTLAVGGRSASWGSWGADGAWQLRASPGGFGLSGGWARRALGGATRDRVGVDGTFRGSFGDHQAAAGAGVSQVSWADGGAWRQNLVGAFAQDVWDVARGVRASGGLRVDALPDPGMVLPSPRLMLSLDPGDRGRTMLSAGYSVFRDPARVLPAAFAEVRLPRDGELLLRVAQHVGPLLEMSLSGAWSRQRFAFVADPALTLLPAGPAATVDRDVATVSAGLAAEVADFSLEASYRLRPQLGAAPPSLIDDPLSAFVPEFLDAYRAHAVDLDGRWEMPFDLVLTAFGRWGSAVADAGPAWWQGARLTVGGGVEQWFRTRQGVLALTASMAVSARDPAASVLPLEAYTLGLGVPSIGDQPPLRGEIGLKFRY